MNRFNMGLSFVFVALLGTLPFAITWAEFPDEYNAAQKYTGQAGKHYIQGQILYSEMFSREWGEQCSNACCESKQKVLYLLGLKYMMPDSKEFQDESSDIREMNLAFDPQNSLLGLHKDYDRSLGKLILFSGVTNLNEQYREAVEEAVRQNYGRMEFVLSSMERLILIDKVLEILGGEEGENFLKLPERGHLDGGLYIDRVKQYLDCDTQRQLSVELCTVLSRTNTELESMLAGFVNAYRVEKSEDDDTNQLAGDYKMLLNGGISPDLIQFSDKERLLKTIKEEGFESISISSGAANFFTDGEREWMIGILGRDWKRKKPLSKN